MAKARKKESLDFDALLESGKTITVKAASRDESRLGNESPTTPRTPSDSPRVGRTQRINSSARPSRDDQFAYASDKWSTPVYDDDVERFADLDTTLKGRNRSHSTSRQSPALFPSTSTSRDLAELARRADYASRRMSDSASLASTGTGTSYGRGTPQSQSLPRHESVPQLSTAGEPRNSHDEGAKRSFTSTMRKTGKFFKKLGKGSGNAPSTLQAGGGVSSADVRGPPSPSLEPPLPVSSSQTIRSRTPPRNILTDLTFKDPQRVFGAPESHHSSHSALRSARDSLDASPQKAMAANRSPVLGRPTESPLSPERIALRARTAPNTPVSKHDPRFPAASPMIRASSGQGGPHISPRTASLPAAERASEASQSWSTEREEGEAPAIRLVSASTTFSNLQDVAGSSSDSQSRSNMVGLGLEPIEESRSREVSASTFISAQAGETPSPVFHDTLPVFVTQDNSPPPASAATPTVEQHATPSPKELARRSVVAFPLGAVPLLMNNQSNPQVSLQSAIMRRNASKRSEASLADDATDEVVEEKARALAERCWEEDETFVERRKMAEWLGSRSVFDPIDLDHLD